ncbi:cysteine peptidase - Clan CA - family C2 / CAL4.1 [Leishmania donovani]|uniref:Adenylosuccinate_lyase_putative/GeneDB:LmjF.04.04 60 n=1 Tax=Leishmania donovani TaxID=5661 RepID=A0A504XUR4_LEIDO|nr:Calpain cysteine protease family protein [Leishmania donovani]CAJ1985889.1 cysteine peptidase - Clan CA - family C2 / CAL4.1 [Leishmania donovani]VDZ41793.1 adenylosuccinate_lyase_putative/GeneDB:LmjF.04.0460 [Leishmania donovani]
MSYPPTEADVISNDSLFSDSVEFDAAEKPIAAEDVHGFAEAKEQPLGHDDRGLPTDDAVMHAGSRYPEEEPAGPPPPVTNAFMKPRKTATKPPREWVPVNLQVPEEDPEDEFDIGTAQKPVYESPETPAATGGAAAPKVRFVNGEPDIRGEVTNCFEEPGLLYRIVDRPNKTWAFYNDSRSFEVHVVCTFGKHSKITPLENTKMTRDESTGEYVMELTVYPGETEPFIKGFVNGFSSKLSALPLSQEYFQARSEAQNQQVVQVEMDAIRAIAGDETDAERILQICLENGLPFVDLSFPPVQSSIESGAAKPFKRLPWGRPRMYVKPELHDQIRLFRNRICPGEVEQGELGDCWLMCAVATQAEDPTVVMQMFRHPKGADSARCERAIGAYRVSFNKNGLWRSILVDDYFPVIAGAPAFAHSRDLCELWPAVLEKAFAKMHGSYAMIQSGDPMHALTDMTGFPAMRIDEMVAKAAVHNGRDLESQMIQWQRKGYQAILTTPGKAPAIPADAQSSPDFSDQPEMEEAFAGTGFLPGHAYSVLDVKEFQKGQIRLICLRNPWVHGSGWTRAWAWDALEWQQHRDIATACGFSKHKGDTSIVWMTFEDALKYFIGGGVLFRAPAAHDARVPITFADCKPGAVFQVSVKAPMDVTFILSNMDHRGMHVDEAGAAESDPNNIDYPPVMLSLAAPVPKETDVYQVVQNSSTDMTQPSDNAWLFLQAREIAMTCHLEPSAAPYLLIPRLMEGDETVGNGNGGGEDMRDFVHPIYYVNDYVHLFRNAPSVKAKEIAVTIGFEADEEIGDNIVVVMCKIGEGNAVFENFPKFPTDDVEPHEEELYFQTKESNCGYAQEKAGTAIY